MGLGYFENILNRRCWIPLPACAPAAWRFTIAAMNIVFFGSPEFAVPTLYKIVESDHRVVAVVTQPDKPTGRGQKMQGPPVKEVALRQGIPVLQPVSLRKPSFAPVLQEFQPDVAVVVAYGKIIPPDVLAVPRLGFLNAHASLLPKYRGAAPVQWALANGEEKTGVTIMQMDAGLDTGGIVSVHELPILDDDDARSLFNMLSVLGGELLVETLDAAARDGRIDSTPQDDAQATLAPLLTKEHGRIDWSWPADKIIWRVRGLVVWPGATTTLNSEVIKITGAELADPSWLSTNYANEAIRPGTVVEALRGRGVVVKTGNNGLVMITRLQFPGKKETTAVDAMNGGQLDVGMALGG